MSNDPDRLMAELKASLTANELRDDVIQGIVRRTRERQEELAELHRERAAIEVRICYRDKQIQELLTILSWYQDSKHKETDE